MKYKTGFVWHEQFMWHEHNGYAGVMPPGGFIQPGHHFDHPETKRRFKNLLDASGLTDRLYQIAAPIASREQLARVHTEAHIANVETISSGVGGDTGMFAPVGPGGFEIAARSAGGAIVAVDAVLNGEVRNAYALLRPPGHHAEPEMGKGFCIFANASIAIRHAQQAHSRGRVALVDWDVHHGNGAQHVFWNDRSTLTMSIHQDRSFPPDSGLIEEMGGEQAQGFNINIPLPAGSGFGAYAAAFDRVIEPALRAFQPDLIVVSCGFDAGGWDPLARMILHSAAFANLTKRMMSAADELCEGRLVLLQEGGYDQATVPFMGLAVIETLSGIATGVADPFLSIFVDDPGHALLQHQEAVIVRAEVVLQLLMDATA
ncbi:MAG TPA: class II histone deacetylase [Xanthomonadales bacterium]|nr:class II histone deacetylase [Xanthomonadales bacterium]